MPTYCYKTDAGLQVEFQYPMGDAPESIKLSDGVVASRDFQAEQGGRRSSGAGWPFECVASGVNAAQAGELREHFKAHGVSCEVSGDGDPIYTSPGQRKRALKCRGMHDRQSFS